jgi:hypothetical protein
MQPLGRSPALELRCAINAAKAQRGVPETSVTTADKPASRGRPSPPDQRFQAKPASGSQRQPLVHRPKRQDS